MSYKSQSANMRKLAELLSQNLGYIFGERESGPNGAKRDFLTKGRVFMSALGKDLGLMESEVRVNKGGIAVSGEVSLQGMWSEQDGIYLWLEQPIIGNSCLCYRTITPKSEKEGLRTHSRSQQKGKQRKENAHGRNHFFSTSFFAKGDYEVLLKELSGMKERAHERKAA